MVETGLIMKRTSTNAISNAISQFEMRREIKDMISAEHVILSSVKNYKHLVEKAHDIKTAQEHQNAINTAATKSAQNARKLFTNEAIYWRIMAQHLHQLNSELHVLIHGKTYLTEASKNQIQHLAQEIDKVRDEFREDLQTARKTVNGLDSAVNGNWDAAGLVKDFVKTEDGLFSYWKMRRESKRGIKDVNTFVKRVDDFRDVFEHARTGKKKGRSAKNVRPRELKKLCNSLFRDSHAFVQEFYTFFLNSALVFRRIVLALNKQGRDVKKHVEGHLIPILMYQADQESKKIAREKMQIAVRHINKQINQINGLL